MRNIIFLLAVTLAQTSIADDRFSEANAGNWQGVGVQIDGQEWSMALQINPASSNVSYNAGECSGSWTYMRVTDVRIVAVEKLSVGLETCLDGGLVKVERLDENALIYSFFDQAGDVVSKAVLIEGEYRQDRYQALRKLTMERAGAGFIKGPDAAITFGGGKT